MKEEKLQLTPQKYKYANKMDNLQGIDKFLYMCSLPLAQEERENKDRPITGNEIESIIKTKETKYCMTSFRQNVQQRQIYTDRKQICGCLEL